MKIEKPKIYKCIDKNLLDANLEDDYTNYHFFDNIDDKIIISNTTFDGCIFDNIDF